MKKIRFYKFRDVKSPVRANRKDSGYDMFIPNSIEDLQKLENCVFTPKENISSDKQEELKKMYFDLEKNTITIPSGYGILIPSGIKFVLPDTDNEYSTYDMVFHNKSGVSTKLNLVTGANVVDNEYRGEVHLHLINTSKEEITIEAGQKIVQFIIRELFTFDTEEISEKEFNENLETDRGSGGFGSSGTK